MSIDISKHPLIKQAYEVCQAIEKCGASTELTDAVTKASALMQEIANLTGRMDELESAESRIAELEARPANPINFKENADADFCRKWAWDEVKKELAPETWTVGDNFNYYGFFCWGWDSRRQYDEQRAAGITVKGE